MQNKTTGIIILEGPDGSGKTTLAEELKKRGAVYRHMGMKKDIWRLHLAALRWAVRMSEKHLVVLDRHWLSEGIYANVFRADVGPQYPYMERAVHSVLERFGAVHVICSPDPATHEEHFQKLRAARPEKFDDMRLVAKVYRALLDGVPEDDVLLNEWFARAWLSGSHTLSLCRHGMRNMDGWLAYDWTEDGLQLDGFIQHQLLPMVDHRWRDAAYQGAWNRPLFLTRGPLGKNVTLLVGDQIQGKPAAPWPFMSNQGSSVYLEKMLHELDIPVERLCYVNANDTLSPFFLKNFAERCGRVVALGRRAELTLNRLDIKIDAAVRHPQRANRFTYSDPTYYLELKGALS